MSKARDLADSVSTGGILEDGAVSVSEISDLTVTAAELNNVAGVNSDVQTQLDLKAPLASPTFTGTLTSDKLGTVSGSNIDMDVNASGQLELDGDGYKSAIALNAEGMNVYTNSAVRGVILGTNETQRLRVEGNGDISFYEDTGTTEKFFWDASAEHLGIGTTSPASELHVAGSAYTPITIDGTSGATIDFYRNGSRHAQIFTDNAGGDIVFRNNTTTERMRIGSSGEIGLSGANYGTSGQVLTSGGSGAAPTWADAAGGGSLDFVATGAISNGDLVGLNADGTVSVIQSFIGSETVFESAVTYFTSSVFDSNSNKVVIVYADNGNSLYGTAVVGTVSGTSISFGTPVVFESDYAADISTTFDSNSNKVVIAYRDTANSNYGTAIVGTVSGTSISFGTPVVFESSNLTNISATFDSNSNKVVIAYRDYGNSEYGTAIVGTVSGTSISFGTAVVFDSTVTVNISAVFDSNSNKVVIAYEDASNSEYGTAVVGTVSGTSISFGTPVVFDSVRTDYISATFDSNSNKVVIAYAGTSTFYGTAVVGTVSGTSISFGTPVTFNSNGATRFIAISFDSNSNKVVIAYRDDGNSNQATVIAGAVSGTSISFGTPYVFDTRPAYTSSAFDSNSNKVVISYMDDFNSDYGTSIVFDANSFSVFSGWVGIAAEDISDTATGSVNIVGGVNEGQTGLTVGSKYYLQNDATISTTLVTGREVGRAIAADKIFITQGSIS